MKINFKKSMYVLTISSALFFQGCGSGGTSAGNNDDNDKEDQLPAGKTFKYNRISIAGSSITWGKGYLGEKSYVGEVIKYFREDVADSIGPGELPTPASTISDLMSYKGELYVYNAGSVISGKLKASEDVSIVFAGSGVDTVVEMEVDGNVCGSYTIQGSFKPVKVISPDNDVDSVTGNVRSFRETEPRSVAKICKNLENREHDFNLTVKSGKLHLNFITNHMYYFQNAGIGGYAASTILGEPAWFPDTTTDEIVDFDPDLFIFESSTNDAGTWAWEQANIAATTNEWILRNSTDFSLGTSSKKIQLASPVSVQAGDVVVMGTYTGNIGSVAVAIVAQNSNSKTITLTTDVPDHIAPKCVIKRISKWETNVQTVIDRVTSGRNVQVGIGTCGVPNLDQRKLMGYREKGKIMADENGWMFFDFFNKVKAFNSGVDNSPNSASRWSYGDNTHPNEENGYRLFGEAITDVLKTK